MEYYGNGRHRKNCGKPIAQMREGGWFPTFPLSVASPLR